LWKRFKKGAKIKLLLLQIGSPVKLQWFLHLKLTLTCYKSKTHPKSKGFPSRTGSCAIDNCHQPVGQPTFKLIISEKYINGTNKSNNIIFFLMCSMTSFLKSPENKGKRSSNQCKKKKERSGHFKCGLRPSFQLVYIEKLLHMELASGFS